jgi:hypothetical protein
MKIINNVIYTLFLISRKRKLKDHYLISGTSTFFILYLNVLSLIALFCWLCHFNFISFFILNEVWFLIITLIGFVASQLYAKKIICQIQKNEIECSSLPPIKILLYSVLSVLTLFSFIMIHSTSLT